MKRSPSITKDGGSLRLLSLKKYVITETGSASVPWEEGGEEGKRSTLTFDRVLLGFTCANETVSSSRGEQETTPSGAGSVDQDCRIISPHTLPKKGSGKKLEFVKCLSSLDSTRALDGLADKRRHILGPLCNVSATPRLMVHILADPSSAVVKRSISGFLALVEDEAPMAAVGSRKTIDVTAEAPWARAKWVFRTYLY